MISANTIKTFMPVFLVGTSQRERQEKKPTIAEIGNATNSKSSTPSTTSVNAEDAVAPDKAACRASDAPKKKRGQKTQNNVVATTSLRGTAPDGFSFGGGVVSGSAIGRLS